MRGKAVITTVLLLFVAASVAYLIVSEMRTAPEPDEPLPWEVEEEIPETAAGARKIEDGVIVYYFHGNVRCKTCRAIEAYTAEAIHEGFEEEIASGRLIWKPVNVDEDGNEIAGSDVPRSDPRHQPFLSFYADMGIPEDFYWFTQSAAPPEGMHYMSEEEMRTYDVITD